MSTDRKTKARAILGKLAIALLCIAILICVTPFAYIFGAVAYDNSNIGHKLYRECQNIRITSKSETMDYGDVFRVYNKEGRFLGRYFDNGRYYVEPFECETNFPVQNKKGSTVVLPEGTLFGGDFFPKLDIDDDVAIFATSREYIPPKGYGINKSFEYGKHGLINRSGKVLLEPIYDDLIYFHDEKLLARIGNERFLLNRQGNRLEPNGDEVLSVETGQKLPKREDYINCKDTTKLKSIDGLWGLEKPNGQMIVEAKYEAIFCYTKAVPTHPLRDHNGVAANRAKRAWCHVNAKGEFTDVCHEHHPAYGTRTKTIYPEKLVDGDAFENSLAWAKQYLDYGEGRAKAPPKLIRFKHRMYEGEEEYIYATPFSPVYNNFHESSKKSQHYPYPELDFRPEDKSEASD